MSEGSSWLQDAMLVGTIFGTTVLTIFAHRIRSPQKDGAAGPSQIAIAGGSMADTFAMEANTAALNKLAVMVGKLVEVHTEAAEKIDKFIDVVEKQIDVTRELRRTIEDLPDALKP